ncbi:Fructokinase [Acidisarcina polymorpha]|uniref:Fructokinase n=1 Tax=Acidisarcina polymorpha TaxID=2211140 RepID=A0A2Z5FSJ5_9BACT|nr:carbohydrate kinase family protein [Acidisarcina polymorpha]AXC09790.1 Fructokinase [Acidisarcina polymorpha]
MQSLDVTIAGEINLDLILYGLPREIPVEREVLASGLEVTLGSSSAILAHNLATLGVATGFFTRMGRDELGEIAFNRLAQSGVDLSRVVRSSGSTTTGLTVLLHHREVRRIITYPGTMFEMSRADLDIEYLASARHFHLSSLFLHRALKADLPQLFRELKARGLTISLDTNDDPEDTWGSPLQELLPLVDILLPNKDELCRIARRDSLDEALGELAAVVPIIAVKCGRDGAIVQDHGKRTRVAAVPVDPVDTIGAGDSFNAGFLAAWLSGCNAEESAAAGNITGAFSTQRPGGTEAFRSPKELASFLRRHQFPVMRGEVLRGKRESHTI